MNQTIETLTKANEVAEQDAQQASTKLEEGTTGSEQKSVVRREYAQNYVPSNQHTSAPWNIHPSLNTNIKPHLVDGTWVEPFWSFSRTVAVGETTIAEVTGYSPEGGGWPTAPIEQVEANARRIIACVNACEGIPIESLETNVIVELVEACERAIALLGPQKATFESVSVSEALHVAVLKAKGSS